MVCQKALKCDSTIDVSKDKRENLNVIIPLTYSVVYNDRMKFNVAKRV